MRLSLMSIVPSLIGVAIIMGGEPSRVDYLRAGVCFLLALALCVAGELARKRDR